MGTRGFAYLRAGAFDKAILDYDAALHNDPKMVGLKLAAVLYGRGVAKQKQYDPGANDDIVAAKELIPDIAEQFARYGGNRNSFNKAPIFENRKLVAAFRLVDLTKEYSDLRAWDDIPLVEAAFAPDRNRKNFRFWSSSLFR